MLIPAALRLSLGSFGLAEPSPGCVSFGKPVHMDMNSNQQPRALEQVELPISNQESGKGLGRFT